jgi:hypothetical protein
MAIAASDAPWSTAFTGLDDSQVDSQEPDKLRPESTPLSWRLVGFVAAGCMHLA